MIADTTFLSDLMTLGATLLLLARSRPAASAGRRLLLAGIVGAVPLAYGHSALAEDSGGAFVAHYTAGGTVEQRVLMQGGRVHSTNTFAFRFSEGDAGTWQLVWTAFLAQWKCASTERIAYNGTDIFSAVYSDERFDRNMRLVPNRPYQMPARVCRGPYPVDHSSTVGLVWLAFVAGPLLARSPSLQIPDLLASSARDEPLAWACRLDYRLQPGTGPPAELASGRFVIVKARLSEDLLAYPQVDEPPDAESLLALRNQIRLARAASGKSLVRSIYHLDETMRFPG